jgi:hypothetical protein
VLRQAHGRHRRAPISSPTTACSPRPPLGVTSSSPGTPRHPPRTLTAFSLPTHRPRLAPAPARARAGPSSCAASSPSTC